MSDYLTNLAARSLEPKPAIQPRLASLFEPLSVVGPLFPRPGRAGDRFEIVAARHEAAENALTQPRVDHVSESEPPRSLLPTAPLNISESFDPKSSEAPPPVSDQQRKTVATTMKLAEPESRMPKETADDVATRDQIVSEARPSEEGKSRIVVPLIGVAVSRESSRRDEPGRPERDSEATKNDVAVTPVANTNETHRPREAAQAQNKLVERRASEILNESRAEERPTAITPLSESDQRGSSLQSLVVPRAMIETIRAERRPRSSRSTESAPPRDAIVRTPISNIKRHQDSRARPTDMVGDESTSPETQPSINVTIGRVEVRALLPTARPTRKDSNAPNLMGLDDYLRQRAQGGKR